MGAGHKVKADVRENERINKQIGLIAGRAPSASHELVNARIQLKFDLGKGALNDEGHGTLRGKWSNFKPAATLLRNICLEHWDNVNTVLMTPNRFAEPSIPDGLPQKDDVTRLGSRLLLGHVETTNAQAWAAVHIKDWKYANDWWEMNDRILACYVVEPFRPTSAPTEARAACVQAEQVNSHWWFASCTLHTDGSMIIPLPMNFITWLDWLASYHAEVQMHSRVMCIRKYCVNSDHSSRQRQHHAWLSN
jgi:hypothetical protein